MAVDDLAAALLSLVDSTFTGIVHIAGADAVSRWEFASLVTGSEQLPSARSADRADPRPLDCRLDTSLSQTLLPTPPRGVREVLRERAAR